MSGWIDIKDRKPAEAHSCFWKLYGTPKWRESMWREQSDIVLVTIRFKDGTKIVRTGKMLDGEWHTDISKTLEPVVTHWMQMPNPAE